MGRNVCYGPADVWMHQYKFNQYYYCPYNLIIGKNFNCVLKQRKAHLGHSAHLNKVMLCKKNVIEDLDLMHAGKRVL